MPGAFDDFELGLAGIKDEFTAGHSAADLAAEQAAEDQNLTAADAEALTSEYEDAEKNQSVLSKAASQTAADVKAGASSVVNGASSFAWALVPTWAKWTGGIVLGLVVAGGAWVLLSDRGAEAAGRAAKVAKAAAL